MLLEDIYLLHSITGEKLPIENAHMESQDANAYYTNKPYVSKKIYYEVKHLEGSNSYLAGFHLKDIGRMYFYAQKQDGVPKLYFDENIDFEVDRNQDLDFNGAVNQYTFGVSIDPFEKKFSIYFQGKVQELKYLKDQGKTEISPAFRETWAQGQCQDTISINFGQRPFSYGLPSGYSTWIDVFPTSDSSIHENLLTFNFLLSFLNV